jgi:hypothetical protein
VFSWQSLDSGWVIFIVGLGFWGWDDLEASPILSFIISDLRGLISVVLTVVLVGAGEFFEEVGVLDGGRDFIVAAGPFTEVDAAAAVGAEWEVFAAS